MVYDEARERVVLVRGQSQETWEWQGNAWSRRSPTNHPPTRAGQSLAYDAARRVMVLYGGFSNAGAGLNDHWEWDGRDWQQRAPAVRPSGRGWHFLAYDAARNRVVLYGGRNTRDSQALPLRDTWEFDGVTWSQRAAAATPPDVTCMAYDALRQRTVLHVALPGATETWEWDGTTWTRTSLLGPPVSLANMVYDTVNARVVLFGGFSNNVGPSSATWAWDGTNWTFLNGGSTPARIEHAMAFDRQRGRVVVHGGRIEVVRNQFRIASGTWEFDGSSWALRAQQESPIERNQAAAAYDRARARVVLHGGEYASWNLLDETWEWAGAGWRRLSPTASPGTRSGHAMAYDEVRQRVVLFGGRATPGLLSAETWEWDGTTWLATTPSARPAARVDAALAYDGPRQRVLLFGGHDGSQTRADTWHWDGAGWTQLAPTTSPPSRSGHALTYDAQRQRVVLFGGNNGNLTDTWEWDGNNWSQRAPATRPAGSSLTMTYDEQRRRVVLVANGTWEWDGTDWTQTETARSDVAGTITYDVARRRSVYQTFDDTWLYGGLTEATPSTFGSACAGSAGPPSITGDTPFLGSVGFGIDLMQANASAPAVLGLATASQSLQLGGGCTLYLAGTLVTLPLATNQAGVARARFALPLQNSLRGALLFAQGFVADPQGAFAGLAVTQGLRLVVGD